MEIWLVPSPAHLNVQLKLRWYGFFRRPVFSSRYWWSLKLSENAVAVTFSEWLFEISALDSFSQFSIFAVALSEAQFVVVVVWLMYTRLCMAAVCVCQTLSYTSVPAVVTCDSRGTDYSLKTLSHSCHELGSHQRSGAVTWSCLYEAHQTQRAVYAAVTSESSTTQWLQGALEWLLEANYSTSGPTLWNLSDLLIPLTCYCALSALRDLPRSFSACITWKEMQSRIMYSDNLHKYIVPASPYSPYKNKKREERKLFSFSQEPPKKPVNAISWLKLYTVSLSKCTHTHIDARGRKLSCNSWSKHSHHVMRLTYN